MQPVHDESRARRPAAPPLAYASVTDGPTRRQFRALLILTAINTILLGGYVLGPALQSFVKEQWTAYQDRRTAERVRKQKEAARTAILPVQEKCLSYATATDQLVYAQDAAGGAQIVAQSDPRSSRARPVLLPAVAPAPDCITQLPKLVEGWGQLFNPRWAYAFVHERRGSPAEPSKLVIVALYGVTDRPSSTRPVREPVTIVALTVRPASSTADFEVAAYSSYTAVRDDDAKQHDGAFLRVSVGQTDPEDPSRFSIPYELTGIGTGSFDGQLLDNELVTLTTNGPINLIAGTHRP